MEVHIHKKTMGTHRMIIGPNIYLDSQSICFVVFWVSYYGWSYARQPEYTPIYSNLSLYLTKLLSLKVTALFSS